MKKINVFDVLFVVIAILSISTYFMKPDISSEAYSDYMTYSWFITTWLFIFMSGSILLSAIRK